MSSTVFWAVVSLSQSWARSTLAPWTSLAAASVAWSTVNIPVGWPWAFWPCGAPTVGAVGGVVPVPGLGGPCVGGVAGREALGSILPAAGTCVSLGAV